MLYKYIINPMTALSAVTIVTHYGESERNVRPALLKTAAPYLSMFIWV